MDERTLYSATDLAKRWGCSVSHIADLESQGILTRTQVGRATYPIHQIHEIEQYQKESPTLMTVKMLKEENQKLTFENRHYKKIIDEYQTILGGCDAN